MQHRGKGMTVSCREKFDHGDIALNPYTVTLPETQACHPTTLTAIIFLCQEDEDTDYILLIHSI